LRRIYKNPDLESDLNMEFSVADMDLMIEQVLEVAKARDRLAR